LYSCPFLRNRTAHKEKAGVRCVALVVGVYVCDRGSVAAAAAYEERLRMRTRLSAHVRLA
jgi:hypothetical protein